MIPPVLNVLIELAEELRSLLHSLTSMYGSHSR